MIENTGANSLYEDLEIFATEFFAFLRELFDTIQISSFQSSLFDLDSNLDFFATELQIKLLKVVLLLLLTSIVLSGICWRTYGEIITDKFIKPSTQKEIEELKLSVAKLKLPKEHSPRI